MIGRTGHHEIGPGLGFSLARPAGFEPATRCLEGSRSIHLSYGRSVTIVHGEDHTKATRRSHCVATRVTDRNGTRWDP